MGAPSWAKSNFDVRDFNGIAQVGAKVEFYDAGTDNARTVYTDSTLSTAFPAIVETDGNGRWPRVFLQLGLYREKAYLVDGTLLWDNDNLDPAPTQPAEDVAVVDPNVLRQVGDTFFTFTSGPRDGTVRANGGTIGNAGSGSSERSNADCLNLYTLLWNVEGAGGNNLYPVVSGKGITPAADFAANKKITLVDLRGRSPIGVAAMGNLDSTRLAGVAFNTGGGVDVVGSTGGEAFHTLVTGEIPAHNHTINIVDPGHFHSTTAGSQNNNNAQSGTGASAALDHAIQSDTKFTGITANSVNTGGGTQHNNMHPFFAGTWRIIL